MIYDIWTRRRSKCSLVNLYCRLTNDEIGQIARRQTNGLARFWSYNRRFARQTPTNQQTQPGYSSRYATQPP